MARDNNPPFERGATFYGGNDIDSNNLGGENLEGKEYLFEDVPARSLYEETNPRTTGFPVVCRVVRNVSGVALQGKRLVDLKVTGYYGRRAAGYARIGADKFCLPSDEFLPDAGVPNNDLFYVVARGPALIKTAVAGDATNVIAEGDRLVALTATTAGATTGSTGGKITPAAFTGATEPLADNIQNQIGTAMSARTTGQTDTDTLVLVGY